MLQQMPAQRLLTGRVLDITTKAPVENAAVTIYKRTTTTTTNSNGYFQLTVQKNDSLMITHQQYKPGFLNIPEKNVFIVYVEPHESYPTYLEGIGSLYTYLYKSLIYPNKAKMKGIEGILLIELTVGENGKMINCQFLNELGGNCEKTAINVFKSIPGSWSMSTKPKILIFPLLYTLGKKQELMNLPEIDLPKGKMMEKIIITAGNNF